MAAIAVGLVLLSGLVHSIWNLFTKRSLNKTVFLWLCQWMAILFFLPLSIMEIPSIGFVSPRGWALLAASMLLHGLYVILLSRAYTAGEMSQAYPMMRGVSPLIVPIVGVTFLGEELRLIGWAGVLLILAGLLLAGGLFASIRRPLHPQAVVAAVLVGLSIAAYTVVDKLTLAYFPAISLNMATNAGNLIALSFLLRSADELKREWRVSWRTIVLGGILAPGGYILFLKALEILPVSQLAPMREIGTVFGTLMAVLILKESQGASRIAASILITLGIIALAR